ncbi:MAG: HelD family protein [Actinomycetota bacterium]
MEELRRRSEANLQDSIDLKTSTPQSVFEREAFASHSRKRLHAVSVSEHQLVFGRLDLQDHSSPVYVGRIGLAGPDQERALIDWRAPVGSAFYRATALAPRGVVRRRTLITRGRNVVDINDDLLMPARADELGVVAGEGALMSALVKERGEFMQDIVATIQAEQDEVIRTDPKASIMLTGGPGTGKSVVALHRSAYLMYERAAELERRGVLVVGPGQRFSRYISRVLPSLGETSVSIRSMFDLTSPLTATRRESLEVARIKGRAAMAGILKRFVIAGYPLPDKDLRTMMAGRIVTVPRARLQAVRSEVLASRSCGFNSAAEQLWMAIAREILRRAGRNSPRKSEVAAAARALAERSPVEEVVEALLPQRTGLQTWRGLTGDPSALIHAAGRELNTYEGGLLALDLGSATDPRVGDLPLIDEMDWLFGPVPTAEAEPQQEPDYHELTTSQDRLDTARQQDLAAGKDSGYGHIVVDEAQDVTAMQWRMLGRRGQDATWTVVGDPAQSTLAGPRQMEESLTRLLGGNRLQRYTLGINYRTPREVVEYASQISGIPLQVESIKSGDPPRVFRYTDSPRQALQEAVNWATQRAGSSCLLVVDENDQASVATAGGIDTMWVLDAKGLEFDNVILFRPEALDRANPSDASLLLIAATRATRSLAVVTGEGAST